MAWGSNKPTFPRSLAALRKWLQDTDEGREVLTDAAKDFLESECRKCERRRPYPKVLVVGHIDDGKPCVEVYWEEGITVKTVELVNTEFGDVSLAEELLRAQLPASWKHMLDTGRRSEMMTLKGLTVTSRINCLVKLGIIREINRKG